MHSKYKEKILKVDKEKSDIMHRKNKDENYSIPLIRNHEKLKRMNDSFKMTKGAGAVIQEFYIQWKYFSKIKRK